jgi:hypothetical protein
VACRKYKVFDEVEPVNIQPSTHNLLAVPLAELGEFFCIDNLSLQLAGLDHTAFQPSECDPSLDLFRPSVQGHSKGVFGEPVLPHPGASAKPVQHKPDRTW